MYEMKKKDVCIMIYGKVAKRFAENGMAVTPLRGKVPTIKGWESTTPSTVNLDSKYDNYNIGLLTGEPSGIITADIDTGDSELEKKLYALMPDTPVMKKGKKGINFLYRYNGEETIKIHNPINTRLVEFELISTGRQTVIPRSIHPDSKKPYIWCDRNGLPSKAHLLNTKKEEIPFITEEDIEKVRECIKLHFKNQKEEIIEKKTGGVAGLIDEGDTRVTHKDLPDYNPKKASDIPSGYEKRCRSGSHDAVVAYMMALINKGTNEEEVIEKAMKYDAEYNLGYHNGYFNCHTNKARGETPYAKAKYYYDSAKSTVVTKKEEAGEKMPTESSIKNPEAAKEMDAVNTVLCGYGIHYNADFEHLERGKENSVNLMKEGKNDFFIYDGDKWNHAEQHFEDRVYRRFNNLFGFQKSHNQITASCSKFKSFVPNPPRGKSLWTQNNRLANLKNGTLHLVGDELVLKPHDRLDLCTSYMPVEYGTDDKNEMFLDMLDRMFDGDEKSIMAVQEMFAIALMPVVARVFFNYGVSGSGKSTIGKIITRLVQEVNISGVPPNDMDGFNLESMLNKRVNMDMDISISKPINDGVFKKIEDGGPQRVRRKGREDIYAPLPNANIWGMNTLPKNFDSLSGAYERRMTIIHYAKSYTKENKTYDRNFAEKVFESSPNGILNFAVEGLKRLIASKFTFTIPDAGQKAMDEWSLESDPIGLFIKDIEEGEVEGCEYDIEICEDSYAERPLVWKDFVKWTEQVGRGRTRITRNRFYKTMEDKGFPASKKRGNWFVRNLRYLKDTNEVQDTSISDDGLGNY